MADDLLKIVQSLRRFRDRGRIMVQIRKIQSDSKVPFEILCSYLDAIAVGESDEFRQPVKTETLRYAGWFILDMERLKLAEEARKKELRVLCSKEAPEREAEAVSLLKDL